MSLPIVIANNQTASAVNLTRLGVTVPASGSYTLTDTAFLDEILEDESLHQAIVNNEILLDLGQGELTKGDSLKFFVFSSLEVRRPVRALADANVGSLSSTTTIDSVALSVDDRVFLAAQSLASENGIWVVKAGAWQRPSDFSTGDSAAGASVLVQEGTVHADQTWNITTISGSDVIGSDPLAAAQSGGGAPVTLQEAYDNGNTILTAGSNDIAFTLASGDFTVDNGSAIFGGATPLTAFNVDAGTMSLDSTDNSNLTMSAADVADKTLTINATNGGFGDGLIALSADGRIDIDAGKDLSVNSSGGVINIGNDANTGNLNIGTGAASRNITVGNSTGTTAVAIDASTGGFKVSSLGFIEMDGIGASHLIVDSGDLNISTTSSGAIRINSVGVGDFQVAGNLSMDSSGGSIDLGGDADDGAINIGTGTTAGRVITIGNNTGTTGVAVETGTGNFLIDAPLTTITGNLMVQGTTSTVESEVVNIADNFLYLNDGYTTTSPLEGGFVVNSLPTATVDTVGGAFVAGVPATSNPTVTTAGSATFAVGDFIQISGANNQANDGLYEVLSHTGTTLTISGIGTTATTYQFTQNDFIADNTVAGTITKVTVGAVQVDTLGNLQYGYGSNSGPFSFSDVTTNATLTLQNAYVGGNTINTSAAEGSVVVSGDQTLSVTATGGLSVSTQANFNVSTFDVQMTGNNGFSVDGTADSNVTASNTASSTNVTMSVGAVNTGATTGDAIVDITATSTNGLGVVEIQADDNINIGTDLVANTLTLGNTSGATGVIVNTGTEQFKVNGVTDYGAGAGLPTATASGFQDGDKYFDTNLGMDMRYDSTRSKWLSVEAMVIQFGRNGNVGANQYFRAINGRIMSATLGYRAPYAGTIVEIGYTRTDSDAATFDVVEGGTSRATLASAANAGGSNTLDGDFSANGILAVRNQAGGAAVSNVIAWLKVRFRST